MEMGHRPPQRCPAVLPNLSPYGSEPPPRVASSAAAASITFPCSSWRGATGTQGGGYGQSAADQRTRPRGIRK